MFHILKTRRRLITFAHKQNRKKKYFFSSQLGLPTVWTFFWTVLILSFLFGIKWTLIPNDEKSGNFTTCVQWRNYRIVWVAKCQGPSAGGGPVGPPASELKTLNIYLPAKYKCLKVFIYYIFYFWNFLGYFIINSADRPTCNEPSLDTSHQTKKCTMIYFDCCHSAQFWNP
jgi:hypothetical protein